MLVHKLGHYPTRFHPGSEIRPLYGYGTFTSRLERMHARGGHMQAPIPTSHHTHTHMLGSHASFHLIPMFSLGSSTPLDVRLTGVVRRSSLLFCVCLGHRVM